MQQQVIEQPPLLLERSQAEKVLGVGPSKLKEIIRRGELREVSIGPRGKRVPLSELERYVSERLKEKPA
jgi:excisionase family DNA binding protein